MSAVPICSCGGRVVWTGASVGWVSGAVDSADHWQCLGCGSTFVTR